MTTPVNIGIIGGGLMGREMASAFARWCAVLEMDVFPRLVAVADTSPQALNWFERLPGVDLLTHDYKELLAAPELDVVYVAVPHQLHEQIYRDVLHAGKDLLAEKPFGIDLAAARRIRDAAAASGRFVRCSSEFPFFPGAHRAYEEARSGRLGRILEVNAGFHHSSDLDPDKPANWKRQSKTCGEIGVLGDLGMHVCHIPFRVGWKPHSVYAQLQRGYPERPRGAKGGTSSAPPATEVCDTWDNALLHTWTSVEGQSEDVPMRLEMKRMAPGESDTWFIVILGIDGGVRYSTKEPKTLWLFERGREQFWKRTDLGFQTVFPTVTGGIFEPGFPDIIQQMWAAFLIEREWQSREAKSDETSRFFGCATPEEAVASQELFAAALESQALQSVVAIPRS